MHFMTILQRVGLNRPWVREPVLAALALALGFGLMPVLIFVAGSAALGRYEGASVARVYQSIYQGLAQDSVASWIVVLGPYGLYLMYRALRLGWQASARLG